MSHFILQLLKGGYWLELLSPPPKNLILTHPPRDRQRAEGLLDNIQDLADQEVIAPVPSKQLCQGFYSRVNRPEAFRQILPDNKSQETEQIYTTQKLPHGKYIQRAETSVERCFHDHDRLKGRLPPCPERPETSVLSKVRGPQESAEQGIQHWQF